MSAYNFTTIDDVAPHMDGVVDWEWGGGASFGGFCRWVWNNHDNPAHAWADEPMLGLLLGYLVSVNENPAEYDLGPSGSPRFP